jgi:hypothetical protein
MLATSSPLGGVQIAAAAELWDVGCGGGWVGGAVGHLPQHIAPVWAHMGVSVLAS